MIRLNLSATPEWVDLGHGVEVLCAPMTSAVLAAAREDATVRALPAEAEDALKVATLGKAIAARVITDWRGVGDAEGAPVPPSPAAISALFDLPGFFDTFNVAFLGRWFRLFDEKKASRPR